MTQEQQVLNYMKENGGITSMEAFLYFNITRLSARIFDLRALGNIIDTEKVTIKNARGNTTTFARYYLVKERENANIQSGEDKELHNDEQLPSA